MTDNDRLIIFVKNLDLGRVETRLAAAIGDEQALSLYHKMLLYTKEITKGLNADKAVYYSDRIDNNDLWDNMLFRKYLQHIT